MSQFIVFVIASFFLYELLKNHTYIKFTLKDKFLPITLSISISIFLITSGLFQDESFHFFGLANDWQYSRIPVILELAQNDWPVHRLINGESYRLHHYLSWYAIPAGLFKFFLLKDMIYLPILVGMSIFIPVYLCLRILTYNLAHSVAIHAYVLLFFLFGGLNHLGLLVTDQKWNWPLGAYLHSEWWVGLWSYPSFIVNLHWSPHHFIAGLAFFTFYKSYKNNRMNFSLLLFGVVNIYLWSPMVALGGLPFIAILFINRSEKIKILPLLINSLVLVYGTIYFSETDTNTRITTVFHPQSPWYEDHQFIDFSLKLTVLKYFLFITIEFGIWFFILFRFRNQLNLAQWVAFIILITLPLITIGQYGDSSLRISQVSLLVLFDGIFHSLFKSNFKHLKLLVLFLFFISGLTFVTEVYDRTLDSSFSYNLSDWQKQNVSLFWKKT